MEITGLGYVGFESPAYAEWKRFGTEVLGMGLGVSPPGDPGVAHFLAEPHARDAIRLQSRQRFGRPSQIVDKRQERL